MTMRWEVRRLAALVVAALALSACAGSGSVPQGAAQVPIRDFRQVAGKWDGNATGLTTGSDIQVFRLTIGEDGKYQAGTAQMMGVYAGSGTLALQDGRLTTQGEDGTATYTLYESDGKRVLRLEGTVKPGRPVSANLTPSVAAAPKKK